MNQRPFIRKLIYLAILVVLLIPLSLLSMPARQATTNVPGSAGGKLAQLREEHGLGQANLGQIDPTSETIKLATLGMRGIAANVLWSKANEYRMKEDWTGFSAALEQIIKLQPNFPTVWQFQGWNLSYNISAEFDDYRDRYFWVMKGIRFLQDGVVYNERSPRLMWYLGWVVSQKIGIADEKVQYRRLFREDTDFHGTRPLDQRDNWLVGREYYLEAERIAREEGVLNMLNPLVFLFHAPKNRINYAVAIEDEGVFEEKAAVAWETANHDWLEFGSREVLVAENRTIRVNDRDSIKAKLDELTTEFDQLPPVGRRELIYDEKLANLPKAERDAFEMPVAKRSQDEHTLAANAGAKLDVSFAEQAERVEESQRADARKLAQQLSDLQGTLNQIEHGREVINYPYWLARCEIERQPATLEARALIHQADKAFRGDQDLPAAQKLYERGFAKWNEALQAYPEMRTNDLFVYDMREFFDRYRALLRVADQPFPNNFPLQDIIDQQNIR